MKEIWKDIAGFEGVYQVSNEGRIKSFKINPKGRILSNKNSKGWYINVALKFQGKRRSVKMHQLVIEAFIGFASSRMIQIHHIDGNRQNNHLDNLAVVAIRTHALISAKENPDRLNGMRRYNQDIKVTPILQYDLQGKFVAEHKNGTEAALASGVCQRNILQVANKTQYKPGMTRKQAGGYIWKLKTKVL